MNLLWKVCGMRETANIKAALSLKPDFMGFIFFDKSSRFVKERFEVEFPKDTKKIGVFVNSPISDVLSIAAQYSLDGIQLHGNESISFCKELKKEGLIIVKAFSIDQDFDFENTKAYLEVCDYFLFDTKGKSGYGGHGESFDWTLLEKYKFQKPFLLAGGIDLGNIASLRKIKHSAFVGIDVNSKFEIKPGLKDIAMLKELKLKLDKI